MGAASCLPFAHHTTPTGEFKQNWRHLRFGIYIAQLDYHPYARFGKAPRRFPSLGCAIHTGTPVEHFQWTERLFTNYTRYVVGWISVRVKGFPESRIT